VLEKAIYNLTLSLVFTKFTRRWLSIVRFQAQCAY